MILQPDSRFHPPLKLQALLRVIISIIIGIAKGRIRGVLAGRCAVDRVVKKASLTLTHMIRLLLVDDHILFLEALVSLMRGQPDFEVVGKAGSVAEAIIASRRHKPDVVLMDFLLPDGTGLDATAAILAERPETKIVFLTAHEDDDRLFEAVRYGAKGYLLKTISAEAMLGALRGLERGEAAVTRTTTARIMEKFSYYSIRQETDSEALSKLTTRERQVLDEICTGATNRQIASRLVISEQTVKNHVRHILAKLDLNNRQEAIRLVNQVYR